MFVTLKTIKDIYKLVIKPFKAMRPSLDVDNHMMIILKNVLVVQYVVKVWPHCLLGFIKMKPTFPQD